MWGVFGVVFYCYVLVGEVMLGFIEVDLNLVVKWKG